MAKLFLSHASPDKPFARRLFADLTELGKDVWLDENDIAAGDDIPTQLQAGIDEADYSLVVLSSDAIKSGWVDREWKTKFWDEVNAQTVKVITLRLEECNIPSFLRCKKYADFSRSYTAGLFELARAIDLHIHRPANGHLNEKAVLFRLLNASLAPHYPGIKVPGFESIPFRDIETFESVGEVVEFIDEILFDFVAPGTDTFELPYLRVFYAHYLGDGIAIGDDGDLIQSCHDINIDGENISAGFVMGISNPHGFPQIEWRLGRAIPCISNGRLLSNCAKVFATGKPQFKKTLSKSNRGSPNYTIEEETAVYTAPVEWRDKRGSARIGLLAASSNSSDSQGALPWSLRSRVRILGQVIGHIFKSLAIDTPRQFREPLPRLPNYEGKPFGFDQPDAQLPKDFLADVTALRRQIATHFEDMLVSEGIHAINGNELSYVHT